MKFLLKKSICWFKVYAVYLDENKNEVRREKLHFYKKYIEIDANLEKEKFVYFTNGRKRSKYIILSDLYDTLELLYNRKTKKITCYLSISNHTDYGTIRTFRLNDEENLSYRSDKSKIINVWTPSNYDPNKEYGVVFMFDSQNIFHMKKFERYTNNEDPYGGWQVESTFENAIKKYGDEYIIVGIDNADEYRMQELMVSAKSLAFKKEYADKYEISTEDFESATLDDLGNFIINTLYPIIENQYKIKKYNVGICGSSAGGNAALYLGMKYSNIFSFIFTLTPAIGFYTDEALTNFFKSHINEEIPQPEIYFFQGVNCDLEKLLAHLNLNLVQNLLEAGIKKENIVTYIEQDAEHNEDAWRFVVNYFMNIHAQKNQK